MRKLLLWVCLCVAVPAVAQDASITQTLTGDGQAATLELDSMGSAAIQVTGTWTGTMFFEATTDGSNWTLVFATPISLSAPVISISENGIWLIGVAGYSAIHVATSGFSGSADVTIRAAHQSTQAVGLTDTQLRAAPLAVSQDTSWVIDFDGNTQPINLAEIDGFVPSIIQNSADYDLDDSRRALVVRNMPTVSQGTFGDGHPDDNIYPAKQGNIYLTPTVPLAVNNSGLLDRLRVDDGGNLQVTSSGLTDAELRATAVPVSGPVTDAELRATAVPVSGPTTITTGTLTNGGAAINVSTQGAPFLLVHVQTNAADSCFQALGSIDDVNFTLPMMGFEIFTDTSATPATTATQLCGSNTELFVFPVSGLHTVSFQWDGAGAVSVPIAVSLAGSWPITWGTDNRQSVTVTNIVSTQVSSITTAVVPGTGLTNLGKAEDQSHVSTDVGVMGLAVRKATPANLSNADGDYEPLQIGAGRLWTSTTIDTALPAGTSLLGKVGIDQTTPGTTNAVAPIAGQAGVQGGSGTVSALTQRVVLATDVALPAGTNAIGKLAANSGVDIGDVDVASVGGNVAVVQDTATNLKAQAEAYQGGSAVAAGNPLQVTLANTGANGTAVKTDSSAVTQPVSYATTGSGTATGAIRVELPTNGTGVIATVGAVTAITNALPAGTNLLGKVGIDQTTPGTTNAVSPIAGQSGIAGGTGVDGATVPRFTLATNVALPAGTNAIGKLAANSGVTIGDVNVISSIPGTGATNLGKAEDSGHTTADTGVMMLGVRNDSTATTYGANNDYTPVATDGQGAVFTRPSTRRTVTISGQESIAAPTAAVWYIRKQWALPSGAFYTPSHAWAAITTALTKTLFVIANNLGNLNLSTNTFTAANSVASPHHYARLFGCVTTVMSATADTITPTYIDELGNSQAATGVAFASASPVGNCYEFPLAAGTPASALDSGVRSVASSTDSAAPTGVVTFYGVNPLADFAGTAASQTETQQFPQAPELEPNEQIIILMQQVLTNAQLKTFGIAGTIR